MKRQQGFTLIELIVVIVILGILAATALPKFADLQSDARAAKINGARGAMQSAAALAHSMALVAGKTSGVNSVQMENQTVNLSNGYPTAAGMWVAAGLTSDYSSAASAGTTLSVSDPNSSTCAVTYTEAAVAGGAPSFSAAVLASSCN